MDFKKNLYWIVLGAIVLFALIAYPMFVTDVEVSASAKRDACDSKAQEVHKLATRADKPDEIKTAAHVAKAKDYRQKIESQIKEIANELKKWTVNTTFSDGETPPAQVIPFDEWLSKHRDAMYKQLRNAQILFPENKFDELTFKDNHTMDVATTANVQRPYRIRRMAIFEEVLGTLMKVHANQDVTEVKLLGTDPWWSDVSKNIPTGVLKVDAFTINDAQASKTAAEANQKDALFTRSGRADTRGNNTPHFADLPYQITTIDLDIEAPLACVPGIVKSLENSEKYHAVITKLDVTRGAFPYPRSEDVAKAGPDNALLNTYYREGPMKVSVSFDIYEYDPAKGGEFEKELSGTAAPAKKK